MIVYIDASVLVSAIFNEPSSAQARSWWRNLTVPPILSDLANIECIGAISRAVRSGRHTPVGGADALKGLDDLRAACSPRSHDRADFALAEQLVRDFATKLAAPDALHLATAMNAGATLATFDLRLAAAARSRGVAVAAIP